jgi:UDPglucose 6-dehydrogenase
LTRFWQNIAVLGFAFKADTGDTRESPAITLVRDFLSERACVTVYDPQVEDSQIWFDLSEALPDVPLEQSMFPLANPVLHLAWRPSFYSVKKQVTIAKTALSAAQNSEAVVVATEWKEFRDIDWRAVYDTMKKPAFVFDGRMILDGDALRQIGFNVMTIGRGDKL